MRISVLIAVYNKEKPENLNLALESIWDNQILKPDEIVLVEDGPLNQDLEAIINFWLQKIPENIVIVKLEQNKGLSFALNEGLKYCKGDYIARMDSDDISLPERFNLQYHFMEQNKNISVLGGSIQEIDDESKILSTRTYPKNTEQIKKYITKACPFAHPTVMFRRNVFDKVKYSDKHRVSQDIELWFNLVKKGFELANLPQIVLYLRRSENFYSRRSRKKAFKESKIYWDGILDLYGISWRLIYPIIRILIRLSPQFLIKFYYKKKFREALNK